MARGKSDGSVIIDTRMNTSGFGSGVRSMQKQIGGLSGAVGKLGATIAATFAVGSLIKFGKEAIDLGSDLQEVQNVVDVTFSSMNEQVNEFAKNAAETAGLSETMAKRYTGTFGAMAKAFGFAESEAFNMSTSLTQLAGDVASFYNLTQDEAYTKLKSVFTGETETLKDLGVVMTQNALDSYAMAQGYGKTTKQMTEQEKVALRYSFVLDQLSAAQGDFVRTSDSWANQTRILSLNFDSFKANIGQALINVFTPFLKVINQIVARMAQLSQYFVAFSELIFGKSISGGGGSPGEAVAEVADGFNDVTEATKEATKAQKKYMSGLDEIRTFNDEGGVGSVVGGFSSGIDFDTTGKQDVQDVSNMVDELNAKYPQIINALQNTVETIKGIINKFLTGDFKGAGKDISGLISGFNNLLSNAIDNVDWDNVGEKIGDFLAGIDWLDVIKSGFTLKFNIWKAIAEVWFGTFKAAPIETAVITALAFLNFTSAGQLLAGKLATAISTAIVGTSFVQTIIGAWASLGGLGGILFTDLAVIIGAGSFAEIALVFATGLAGALVAAIGGFALGEQISAAIWPENEEYIKMGWDEQWRAIFESFKDGSFVGAFDLMGKDLKKWFSNLWEDIKIAADAAFQMLVDGIKEKINLLKGLFSLTSSNKTGNKSGKSFNLWSLAIPSAIPHLASGAVIPPNAPFMAMLGDQRHGTNIEAPLDTIKQAVREVVGTNNSGGQYQFTAQLNRRVIFDEIIEEARLRQTASGRNVFMTL